MSKIIRLIALFYILYIPSLCFAAPYIIPLTNKNTDTLSAASKIAMSGIQVQNQRMKVISQNIANIDVTGATRDSQPYRRKIVFFENTIEPISGAEIVKVQKISQDNSDFIMKYQPNHPAANVQGYVAYPNINPLIEIADAREAERAVAINANSLEMIKSMQFTVLSLMKK